jgi:hypothetical protein
MLAIDRWRNWRPSTEKFDDSPGCEPPKPSETTFEGFEGSSTEYIQHSFGCPADAPDGWREDFDRWKTEKCSQREGREDWGGIGCLWIDFCEWAVKHDSAPCQRCTFEHLLERAGFPLRNGMAAGLVLRADLEAALALS